jgi:hypothetical protein
MRPANAAHRPRPLPNRPWVLAMQWHDYCSCIGPYVRQRYAHSSLRSWSWRRSKEQHGWVSRRSAMAEQLRLMLPSHKPLRKMQQRLDVVGWTLERVHPRS